MAKTGKIKKKPSTIHSRAARRVVSPSIDLDKSLKPTTRTSPLYPPSAVQSAAYTTLGARPAGIIKKFKAKPLKRQQRVRREKELERAVVNLDKFSQKITTSVGKEKRAAARKKGWEDVNGGVVRKNKKDVFEALEDDEVDGGKEREWVSDEDMDAVDDAVEVEGDVEMLPEVQDEVVPESVPLPVATVEEDELL